MGVLVGVSLVVSNVEHLSSCSSAASLSSLEKHLFRSFAHFRMGLCACVLIVLIGI